MSGPPHQDDYWMNSQSNQYSYDNSGFVQHNQQQPQYNQQPPQYNHQQYDFGSYNDPNQSSFDYGSGYLTPNQTYAGEIFTPDPYSMQGMILQSFLLDC